MGGDYGGAGGFDCSGGGCDGSGACGVGGSMYGVVTGAGEGYMMAEMVVLIIFLLVVVMVQ